MAGFAAQTKKIGERMYSVKPLPFGKGREGLTRLLAIVVPSAGEALARGASVATLLDGARGAAAAGELLSGVAARLDDAALQWFEDAFGNCSTVDIGEGFKLDKPDNRAMAFGGDYLAYFEWIVFAIEVNYRDFFVGALAKLKRSAPSKTGLAS